MQTEHPENSLVCLAAGGFLLDGPAGETIRAKPAEDGLRIEGPERIDGWRLLDSDEGFLLERTRGDEAGRSLRSSGDGIEEPTSILLDDGRLFRMILRGPRDPRHELIGWETAGSYFEIRPDAEGWTIRTTVAGHGLDEIDALLLLMAAELNRGAGGEVFAEQDERTTG